LFVLLYSLWLYGIRTRYEYWDQDHGGNMQVHLGGKTWCEFQWGALLIALLFLGNEVVQIRAQLGNYATMGWNWIDLATLITVTHQMCYWLLYGQLPMETAQEGQMSGLYSLVHREVPSSAVYTACTALLVYIRLLTYLRGYRPTAALVTMLNDVARDILPFLFILAIVLLGFSSVLFLLGEFKTPLQAVFSTFTIMLGEFYLDDDHRFNDTIVVQLVFVGFALTVLVVMLNLLIAIISDTFERVIEKQNARFWKQLAILIRDLEQLLALAPSLRLQQPSHQWLHALVPMENSLSANKQQWSGRVDRLTAHVDEQVGDVKAQVDDVKAQVGDVKAQVRDVNAKVDDVNAKVDDVNAKVDKILELLAKQQ
jgi:hypothetical protein